MRIARRDFQKAEAAVATAEPAVATAEPAVAEPAESAAVQRYAPTAPAELDGEVAEHQRRVVARAHSLGAKATELAREIV